MLPLLVPARADKDDRAVWIGSLILTAAYDSRRISQWPRADHPVPRTTWSHHWQLVLPAGARFQVLREDMRAVTSPSLILLSVSTVFRKRVKQKQYRSVDRAAKDKASLQKVAPHCEKVGGCLVYVCNTNADQECGLRVLLRRSRLIPATPWYRRRETWSKAMNMRVSHKRLTERRTPLHQEAQGDIRGRSNHTYHLLEEKVMSFSVAR